MTGAGSIPQTRSKSRPGQGVGIFGMRERANLVGGDLQIDSAPGIGTEVRINIPLRATSAAEETLAVHGHE